MAAPIPEPSSEGAVSTNCGFEDYDRVTITVQWRESQPPGGSRAARRVLLAERLHEILDEHPDLAVDWSSISLAAQTVEATVPRDQLATAADELEERGLRVDEVVERQVAD